MASKQNPAAAEETADTGTFQIKKPIRSARGDLYRPGMEVAYLRSSPSDDEVKRHRDTKSIAGKIPKQG